MMFLHPDIGVLEKIAPDRVVIQPTEISARIILRYKSRCYAAFPSLLS
jgi:hypothetical protein